MSDECEVNLQWKGIDACYDFYCPCGGEVGTHGHEDGDFKQQFQCGACGRWWHLSNTAFARPGKYFRDDGGYGCDDCKDGHRDE